jgi:ribosomal protein L12E/L44/L45/RPP1/RPP2
MKHLAAYLLLNLGGNTSPSAGDIKEVLSSVGIDTDDDRLEKLLDELKGKDLAEVRPPMTWACVLRDLEWTELTFSFSIVDR